MNTNNSSILCTSDKSPDCDDLNGPECYAVRKIAILLTNNNSNFFIFIFIPIRVAGLEVVCTTPQGTINTSFWVKI